MYLYVVYTCTCTTVHKLCTWLPGERLNGSLTGNWLAVLLISPVQPKSDMSLAYKHCVVYMYVPSLEPLDRPFYFLLPTSHAHTPAAVQASPTGQNIDNMHNNKHTGRDRRTFTFSFLSSSMDCWYEIRSTSVLADSLLLIRALVQRKSRAYVHCTCVGFLLISVV